LRAAVAQLTAALGPCDVIVANAGVHGYTPGFALNSDEFARVWATNVQGVVNTLAAVLPDMVARRRGHVVTIASLAGLIGLPDVGAYCASKAALITLMQSLRVDLHPYGVGVTTVCPGFVDTPFIAGHDRRVMKFMVSADDAARRIARAVARGAGTCVFPWQTWLMTQIGRWLPFPLYRRVIAGAVRRTP
jgi:short-subunit dehydrogenase